MRLLVSVLLFGLVLGGSSCFRVRVHLKGDVLVHPADEGKPTVAEFETTKVVPVDVNVGVLCVVTGVLYGGSCWANLFAPFNSDKEKALYIINQELRRDAGRCAEVDALSVEYDGDGWYGDDVPMSLTMGGQKVKTEHLCVRSDDR